VRAVAAGVLPDGAPVVISGGRDGTVRVWRLADGTPIGKPLRGHDDWVTAVAAGVLPDGAPVVISGGRDGTVRVWRLADGTAIGEPLRGHTRWVRAVAAGALPDGSSIIVSSAGDGTVRVWRLADGTPGVAQLDLPESVRAIAVHGSVIVTAARDNIAVHQLALP
jgi:WD40 repeat protein